MEKLREELRVSVLIKEGTGDKRLSESLMKIESLLQMCSLISISLISINKRNE